MSPILAVSLLLSGIGCGGAPPPAGQGESADAESRSVVLSPTEGGPLVRMERLVLPAGESLVVEPTEGQEVLLVVESGALGDYPAGSVVRARGGLALQAVAETSVFAAVINAPSAGVTAEVSVVTVEETSVLSVAGGKLRVQIFHDEASGAAQGAFSLLDADADLSVPEHVHEESVEVLYILSGDGTMILGDDRSPVAPGQVLYVPMNTNHGYEAGTEPLRAYQVYAPPGPEQRFRNPPHE